jgi:hypothetical protein
MIGSFSLPRLFAALSIGLLLATISLRMETAFGHGDNPDHISLTLGPGKSGTVTSTPFSSAHTGTCGASHGIDHCHHHALAESEWSADIGATDGQPVYLSVMGYPGFVTVTNKIASITPMCSATDPAAYNVTVEVWARLESNQIWRNIGLVSYVHITPSSSIAVDGWYWPSTLLGTTGDYTWYNDCWEGVHLHMDSWNKNHYSGWYNAAWNGTGVTYSSSYWSMTPFGVLGGTGGQGPDSHGGAWTGY